MLRIAPLFALMFLISGCRAFDGVTTSDKVDIVEDIPYVSGSNHKKHRLDFFLPKGKINSPTVIFIHGGFWKNQDRRYYWPFTGLYRNVGFAIASRGFPVAVISYRLSPEVDITGELADAAAAVAWVAGNAEKYGADASRIVLMGHSSGGHLASMLSLDSSLLGAYHLRIKGCVALSPILDIKHMERTNNFEFNTKTTYVVFGKNDTIFRKYSPSAYLNSMKHIPYLLLIGSNDFDFLKDQAKKAISSEKNDPHFRYKIIPEYDHSRMVLNINTKDDQITPAVIDFISTLGTLR